MSICPQNASSKLNYIFKYLSEFSFGKKHFLLWTFRLLSWGKWLAFSFEQQSTRSFWTYLFKCSEYKWATLVGYLLLLTCFDTETAITMINGWWVWFHYVYLLLKSYFQNFSTPSSPGECQCLFFPVSVFKRNCFFKHKLKISSTCSTFIK